jgi:PEP-CTERM motif
MRKLEGIVEWLFLRGSPLSSNFRIALLVACVPVLLALPFIGRYTKLHHPGESARLSSLPSEARSASPVDSKVDLRPLYPYSVIPGGAYSAQELRNAIERDPVVAHHYAGFDLAKVRIIRLDRDRMEYVSYRLGDRIFWTNHELRLHKGEALITDGTRLARTRCGNRLSDHAVEPTSAAQPSTNALNSPEPAAQPELFAGNYLPEEFPQLGPPVLPGGGSPGGSAGTIIPPIYFPVVGGTAPGSSTPPTPPPPVNTPEPDSLLLLASGLASLWVFARRKNRRS